MSNFFQDTLNPATGKIERAHWLDDYFGRHRYGVVFPDHDLRVYSEDEIKRAAHQPRQGERE